ncbi:MAG: BTAD domain-containing putative transcriptional regulator, partial [Acidimicrobiia bacterium]
MFEFRVLGPLEVVRNGEGLIFRGNRERALLALLILNANQVVSGERLAEDLWSGNPPEGALKNLRVYVSRIRQALGDPGDVVVTRPSGYLLEVDPMAIDAGRFDSLVAQGRREARAADLEAAARTLREALDLWRGPALADVASAPFARAEATRLEDTRLSALEDRVEADLACGRHIEVATELDALTRAHPLRERFWALWMVALYRSGRQADALRAYQELRQILGEQLGIDPSEPLRRLEGAVLRQDPDLDWRPAAAAPSATDPPPAVAGSGVVTFLFTDVVGSTELLDRLGEDAAEAARQAHFALLRQAVTAHGGHEV